MNLVLCPNCRNGVSPQAAAWTVCGRPMQPMMAYRPPPPVHPLAQEKQNVQLAYGLYAGSYLLGPLVIAALVLCYIRRGEARGTWMEAHYNWLIDTFWAGMLGAFALFFAGMLMMFAFFPVGIVLFVGMGLFVLGWPIYRLIVGWMALDAGRTPVGSVSSPRW